MKPPVACGFSSNSCDQPFGDQQLPEAPGRPDRGDGSHLAVALVKRDQLTHVEIGDAVPVGAHDQVVVFHVPPDGRESPARHGRLAGVAGVTRQSSSVAGDRNSVAPFGPRVTRRSELMH